MNLDLSFKDSCDRVENLLLDSSGAALEIIEILMPSIEGFTPTVLKLL
tara:strand:- start:146 stop:289 length:144 start_codon:yes stop_codon:yes gene_type:complete